MTDEPIATMQKAFSFNMDKDKYGTIAEIGAGQEVARSFFNTVLRRPVDAPFEVKDVLTHKPFGLAYEKAVETALKQRAEIQIADLDVTRAEKDIVCSAPEDNINSP